MGNCQAIDNASLVIQHPCGRVDQMYWPIAAGDVMKMNPGHYVALLLTTTLYPSPTVAGTAAAAVAAAASSPSSRNGSVRITRIKLLRPSDTLALGHAYRLITTQEVMNKVRTKRNGKIKKKESESESESCEGKEEKEGPDFDTAETRALLDCNKTSSNHQQGNRKSEKQRARTCSSSRAWHPSLQSITESSA